MNLLTAEQMRALEQAEMAAGRQSGLALMERAGRGVVDAVFKRWPDLQSEERHAVILCGPGNNGGDGFVIGRLLAEMGWHVALYLWGAVEKLPPDARANHDRYSELCAVNPWRALTSRGDAQPDVVFDAIFGIGLTRAVPDDVLTGIAALHGRDDEGVRRVAVDCPSGLNLDTGQGLFGVTAPPALPSVSVMRADLTVTFHCPKPGHFLQDGPALCGAVEVVDIGLSESRQVTAAANQNRNANTVYLVVPDPADRSAPHWPMGLIPKTYANGHKFNYGHLHVFSGGVGRGGAARLAARAGLRSGVGLVTVICPPEALSENSAALDAVMLRALAPDKSVDQIADSRVTAFCLGPGMGLCDATRARVLEVLGFSAMRGDHPLSVVLDADALTVFENAPEVLFEAIHERTVLTPHEGEFARLFPDLAQGAVPAVSKVDRARRAAARAGCVVLLKGTDTVIATPDGRASLHAACYDRAVPWLATAGAGDVLAGLIAGLAGAAPQVALHSVVEAAAWLHVEAARNFGPGLIAEDLPDVLPDVFRALMT